MLDNENQAARLVSHTDSASRLFPLSRFLIRHRKFFYSVTIYLFIKSLSMLLLACNCPYIWACSLTLAAAAGKWQLTVSVHISVINALCK